MERTKRSLGPMMVIGIVLAGTPALAHRVRKQFSVGSHPVVTLRNASGRVVIHAWQKHQVEVVADQQSANVDVEAKQQGNMVVISTRILTGNVTPADLTTNYQISVPEETELSVKNDAGEVDVQGVLGDMSYETIAADVNLNRVTGDITVRTVGGTFTCNQCSGRIEANSISGAINVIGSESGNVQARSSTGNILLDSDLLPDGLYQLRDYSGQIDVFFSPSDSFDVSATSLRGKVVNEATLKQPAEPQHDLPAFASSLTGVYNEGHARLVINTFSGTIQIRRRQ